MSTRVPLLHRRPVRTRVGAAAAVVILPLALTACGGADKTGGDPSAQTSTSTNSKDTAKLEDVKANLLKSKAASFSISLDDASGNLKKALVASDPTSAALADRLIGGRITLSIDPTGDKTFQDLQGTNVSGDSAAALKSVNVAIKVEDKDGSIAELRLVDGYLYGTADLDKIDQIAKEGGSTGVAGQIDSALAQLPGGAAIGPDLRAGKFLKLNLSPFVGQLANLAGATPAPSAAPSAPVDKQLTDKLLAAVKPFTQINATGKGKYDVELEAKSALKAAVAAVGTSIPGITATDTADLEKLQDGKLKATFTLDGDHLKEVTLDLGSVIAVAPADPTAPNLDGSSVKLSVDDSAAGVSVPDKVSDVDLNSLLGLVLGSLSSK